MSNSIKNPFTDHPHSVDETFVEHFFVATGFGTKMILGGIACCLHGFFPFAFTTTGSHTVRVLYEKMSSGARQKVMQNIERTIAIGRGIPIFTGLIANLNL
jgi:Family of unknown function (DUF6356)